VIYNAMRPKQQVIVIPRPPPSLRRRRQPIDLGEQPVTGESDKAVAATDKLSSCVMGYMPKDTFGTAPDSRRLRHDRSARRATSCASRSSAARPRPAARPKR